MKDNKDHKDDGIVNRDGITQGSGYGDTKAKTRDAEAKPETDDYDKARLEQPSADKTTDITMDKDHPKGKP